MKIPPELTRRYGQSVIVANMVLLIFAGMRQVYQRKRNLNAMLEELVVACTVRQNDASGGEAMTVGSIAKALGIPRTNVARATVALIKTGLIMKEGTGFVGDLNFLVVNHDAAFFKDMVAAILTAATELQALDR